MKRDKYKVNVPREHVLTRDYWELLQVDPEDRVEFTNKFFYKDFIITQGTKASEMRKILKARREGWLLYELVDLETPDDTVICRTKKTISVAVSVLPPKTSASFVIL